jgi:hypothetical protein
MLHCCVQVSLTVDIVICFFSDDDDASLLTDTDTQYQYHTVALKL